MDEQLTFREYQRLSLRSDRTKGDDLKGIMIPLLGLAGEAGSLLSEYKKWLREGDRYKPFTEQVSEEIGDILWYLANIAEKEGLDLQEIAEENLAKLAARWGTQETKSPQLFDADHSRYDSHYRPDERLPAQMRVMLYEVIQDGRKKVAIEYDGRIIGDYLTDNSHVDDGYRFHDVFHLSLATVLGWSPILRGLLKVKRKSVPQIDEVEDGARAAAIEEAISAIVFGYAKDYSYFKDSDTVEYEILRTVKLVTRSVEVRDRTYRDWEEAILAAYRIWRQMIANNGGVFVGDATRRSVTYERLPSDEIAG